MMKMSGGVTSGCVALFLALTSVSAVQQLDSINDFNFGSSQLMLLHWFATTVEINTDDVCLNFDLNRGDYGSHHYGNFEGMLNRPPWGYRYYTVGNLNADTSRQLPPHVRNTQAEGGNRDRIIIRVQEQNTRWGALRRVDQVYITQHVQQGILSSMYDPGHTYQITTNLLRQIRRFSVNDLRNLYGRNTWYDQQSYRPQSGRLQSNSTWQTNNRLESRQNDCSDCCRALACCVLLLVIFAFLSFSFFNAYHKKRGRTMFLDIL